jgi:hypothetical protein
MTTTPQQTLQRVAMALVFTFSRTLMIAQVPTVALFGGPNPNGWFGPWVGDSILGLLTPWVIYGVLFKTGAKPWGLLLAFNVVGAWDYANGLLAQYLEPTVTLFGDPAPQIMIYGSIGVGMIFQLIVVLTLLRGDVIQHFLDDESLSSKKTS